MKGSPRPSCPRCGTGDAGTVPDADLLALVCRFCRYIWEGSGATMYSGAGGYLCGQCGFASSDVDAMVAHDCPQRIDPAERETDSLPKPTERRTQPHWRTDGGP